MPWLDIDFSLCCAVHLNIWCFSLMSLLTIVCLFWMVIHAPISFGIKASEVKCFQKILWNIDDIFDNMSERTCVKKAENYDRNEKMSKSWVVRENQNNSCISPGHQTGQCKEEKETLKMCISRAGFPRLAWFCGFFCKLLRLLQTANT